jgi:3-phosphoshikimate 1-carboxyvinyltransferase
MSRTLIVSKSPPPQGTIFVPGDKSISHRALIFAALGNGPSELTNILPSEDVLCTANILRQMGITIDVDDNFWTVHGVGLKGLRPPKETLYCGNSGTTLRLMTGLLSAQSFGCKLTGDISLNQRPMDRIIEPLTLMGAKVSEEGDKSRRRIVVKGGQVLKPMHYSSPVASAQVKSAILLAGLYVSGSVSVTEPLKSRDHTERMMKALGCDISIKGSTVTLNGAHSWEGREFLIPGDLSSAAFPLVATLIHPDPQAAITVCQVGLNKTRTGLLTILESMGAKITISNRHDVLGELMGDIDVQSSQMKAVKVDPHLIPSAIDEVPILAVAAAAARGTTELRGAAELRVKESDRIKAIVEQLSKLGIPIREFQDGFDIEGSTNWRGAHCRSYGDHRMAMSLAVAGMIAEGTVRIENVDCIETSFPGFVPLMESLQALIRYA